MDSRAKRKNFETVHRMIFMLIFLDELGDRLQRFMEAVAMYKGSEVYSHVG